MRARVWTFLTQPEVVDEDRLRLVTTLLMAAGGLFFFRLKALPALVGCLAGGGAVLAVLWAGFHRLGLRPLGGYWPGVARGVSVALLLFCLLPPGLPWVLAGLLGALAVAVEGVQRKALVPLAFSGVSLAWLLAWLWQSRAGTTYIAPFDFHAIDEPITLWLRFQVAVDPVRAYAGQVAGPLGATSFGLVAICVLGLSYARAVSWHLLLAFYIPVLAMVILGQRPIPVYALDAPALAFAALVAADARRLPRSAAWRVAMGLGAGLVAAGLLYSGTGFHAFGIGVVACTAVVAVFQFFGLAGSPGALQRRSEARRDRDPGTGDPDVAEPVPRRTSAVQVIALSVALPLGLVLVWRDDTLRRSERSALVTMGAVLYFLAIGLALAWFWFLRIPT
ncbi:MAG: hypothetical protein ABR573_04420 [Candidatus Dormibacteria bacterium]